MGGWFEVHAGIRAGTRVFRGPEADLVVWPGEGGAPARWQLAWSTPRAPQRIVEWSAGGNLRTGVVDEDDRAFSMLKGAPIVRSDPVPDPAALAAARALLASAGAVLPAEILAALGPTA